MSRSKWPAGSRHARGYGSAWDKQRLRILERDCHLCRCSHCKAEGRTTLATEVDHVVSRANAKALGWSEERTEADANLQAINSECHKRKTIEDQRGTHRERVRFDSGGWPIW